MLRYTSDNARIRLNRFLLFSLTEGVWVTFLTRFFCFIVFQELTNFRAITGGELRVHHLDIGAIQFIEVDHKKSGKYLVTNSRAFVVGMNILRGLISCAPSVI